MQSPQKGIIISFRPEEAKESMPFRNQEIQSKILRKEQTQNTYEPNSRQIIS